MIKVNSRKTDQYDVAVLFSAMVTAEDEAGEAFDTSLVQIGYDEALLRCRIAAAVLARDHAEQGDESDGVWWLEILQEGGLALDLYFSGDVSDLLPHEREARVAAAVHDLLRIHQPDFMPSTDPLPTY